MWPIATVAVLVSAVGEVIGYFATRALLNQYLKVAFGLRDEEAKGYVHLFNALSCLFPMVGGAVADSYLGKFTTYMGASMVAVLGSGLLTAFSVDGVVGQFGAYPVWSFVLPIVLITVGMGMANPCFGSLAGDQFEDAKAREKFFALSLVANLAILFAVTAIPLLKDYAGYPAAFFTGTLCYLAAFLVFLACRRTFVIVPPHGEFLPWTITKLVAHAAGRRMKGHRENDWLQLASDRYDGEVIQEARQFLRVVVILAPLVFMWVLHEQTSTEWQNQYDMMDKTVFGVTIPTESSSLVSALLVIVLLPVFGFLVFPGLERLGVRVSLGARVAVAYGCFLAAFGTSVVLQYSVVGAASNRVLANNVAVSCEGCVSVVWQLPQWLVFSIGGAILGPNLGLMMYSSVGPKLKASAMSLVTLTVAIANLVIILMEPFLNQLMNPINRQWCYVTMATLGFCVYLLLLKLCLAPTPPEEKGSNDFVEQP